MYQYEAEERAGRSCAPKAPGPSIKRRSFRKKKMKYVWIVFFKIKNILELNSEKMFLESEIVRSCAPGVVSSFASYWLRN